MSSQDANPAAVKPSTLFVLQIDGLGDKKLLDRIIAVLEATNGVEILDVGAYTLSLVYEKDDDVEDPIKPDDEKWGWTKADGSLIIITAMKKKV